MLKKTFYLLPFFLAFAAHANDIAPPQLPGDNDVLIKRYMETKDARYLQTMLQTYAAADDGMLRDARRYAFIVPLTKNTTDPRNPRPNLNQTTALALCAKYQCQPDPAKSKPFMQVMTASSGIWALDSLSQQDPQIKKIVEEYINASARMKQIYIDEAMQFSNYKVLVITSVVQPQKVESLLAKYETFQPLDMEEVKTTLGMQPMETPAPVQP